MTLSDFIEQVGDAQAAELFGVKRRTAASWRRRERTPRPQIANEIVARTGGAVPLEGIYHREAAQAA